MLARSQQVSLTNFVQPTSIFPSHFPGTMYKECSCFQNSLKFTLSQHLLWTYPNSQSPDVAKYGVNFRRQLLNYYCSVNLKLESYWALPHPLQFLADLPVDDTCRLRETLWLSYVPVSRFLQVDLNPRSFESTITHGHCFSDVSHLYSWERFIMRQRWRPENLSQSKAAPRARDWSGPRTVCFSIQEFTIILQQLPHADAG